MRSLRCLSHSLHTSIPFPVFPSLLILLNHALHVPHILPLSHPLHPRYSRSTIAFHPNSAQKLRRDWIETQKLKSKWRAQKRREGLVKPRTGEEDRGNADEDEDEDGDQEEGNEDAEEAHEEREAEASSEEGSDEDEEEEDYPSADEDEDEDWQVSSIRLPKTASTSFSNIEFVSPA